MVDVEWAMKQLNMVYRSEDHFQFSLATELAQMYGDERLRLEWQPSTDITVDIGVRREGITIPIELKYKTDHIQVIDAAFDDEEFEKINQRDYDRSHYDFWKDVRRIERVVADQGGYGYVVLLTNDSNYWTTPSTTAKYDEFRIHEGQTRSGTLQWRDISDWMVEEGRDDPWELEGEYKMEWRDYRYRNDISASGNSEFRYLALRID